MLTSRNAVPKEARYIGLCAMLCQPDIWSSLSELAWVFLDKAMCLEGVLGFPWEFLFFFKWKIEYVIGGIWRGQQVPAACLGGELHFLLLCQSVLIFMERSAYWDLVVSSYNASCGIRHILKNMSLYNVLCVLHRDPLWACPSLLQAVDLLCWIFVGLPVTL